MRYADRSTLIKIRDSLKSELQIYYQELIYLKEQKAQYGLAVPFNIAHRLDELQQKIENIEIELG